MASKLSQAMSPEEYAAKGYGSCPVCRSWEVSSDEYDSDGARIIHEMHCADCDATWQDVYRLEGYIELDRAH